MKWLFESFTEEQFDSWHGFKHPAGHARSGQVEGYLAWWPDENRLTT